MNKEKLKEILNKHFKWLIGEDGERANLRNADLSNFDLYGANLCGANLYGANLRGANLRNSDLYGANLCGANLYGADLRGADLRGANLRGANLRNSDLYGANLCGADLRAADLRGADMDEIGWNIYTTFYQLQCPEKGSYIAYKKANNMIVELEITEDAFRSSATSRKCRASKAKVLSITDLDGKNPIDKIASNYDSRFIYTVGEIVEVKDFDTNRWNECSTGIHHFITREEAVRY